MHKLLLGRKNVSPSQWSPNHPETRRLNRLLRFFVIFVDFIRNSSVQEHFFLSRYEDYSIASNCQNYSKMSPQQSSTLISSQKNVMWSKLHKVRKTRKISAILYQGRAKYVDKFLLSNYIRYLQQVWWLS